MYLFNKYSQNAYQETGSVLRYIVMQSRTLSLPSRNLESNGKQAITVQGVLCYEMTEERRSFLKEELDQMHYSVIHAH